MDELYRPTRPRGVTPVKVQRARELRREMTPEERILWRELRLFRSQGYIFRGQQVIAGFFCFAARLVVEVDGGVHAERTAYDTVRDEILAARGMTILRDSNDEVRLHLLAVVHRIHATCEQRVLPFPSRGEGVGG